MVWSVCKFKVASGLRRSGRRMRVPQSGRRHGTEPWPQDVLCFCIRTFKTGKTRGWWAWEGVGVPEKKGFLKRSALGKKGARCLPEKKGARALRTLRSLPTLGPHSSPPGRQPLPQRGRHLQPCHSPALPSHRPRWAGPDTLAWPRPIPEVLPGLRTLDLTPAAPAGPGPSTSLRANGPAWPRPLPCQLSDPPRLPARLPLGTSPAPAAPWQRGVERRQHSRSWHDLPARPSLASSDLPAPSCLWQKMVSEVGFDPCLPGCLRGETTNACLPATDLCLRPKESTALVLPSSLTPSPAPCSWRPTFPSSPGPAGRTSYASNTNEWVNNWKRQM